MVVGIKVVSMCNTTESPAVDLTSKRSIASVPKENRNDAFFKRFRVVDSPRSSVREPTYKEGKGKLEGKSLKKSILSFDLSRQAYFNQWRPNFVLSTHH